MSELRRSPLWQFAAVFLGLTVVAGLLYGSNAIHGGYISDAWTNRTQYIYAPHPGFFEGITQFLKEPNISVRPLLAFYLSFVNFAFGSHMGVLLTWMVATNVVMCALLYLLLRRLRMAAIDAAIVALLVLIFPAAAALRLWAAMVAAPVTISLVLVGFLLALKAFEIKNQRASLALHGISILIFAASVLLYELALPVMLLSVLIYRLKVPWRPAIYKWLADCAVLLTLALSVTRSSSSGFMQTEGGGMIDHAREIYGQLHILLATKVLPFSSSQWYIMLLLALIPVTGCVLYRLLPAENEMRSDLRRWLTVMAAGTIIVLVSYTIFVPAIDYYLPLRVGDGSRINAVPSIGWVLLFYGGARLIGVIVFRGVPDGRRLGLGLAVLACTFIAIGWIKVLKFESDSYIGAFREDLRVLNSIQAAIPNPVTGATIWTFGQPVLYAPEIPVFGNSWDMTSAVQLQYDNPTLHSYVGQLGTEFVCEREGMKPAGVYLEPEAALLGSRYGTTYFINTTTGEYARIDSQVDCRRAASSFEPSPIIREE